MRRAAGGWVGLYWRAGVSCSSAWQFISQLHLLGQPLFMPVSLSATPLGELSGERHFLWAVPGTQGKGQPFLCRAQNNRSIGCPSHVMVSLVSSFCWIVQALLSTVSVDARGANMRRNEECSSQPLDRHAQFLWWWVSVFLAVTKFLSTTY